MTYGKLEGEKRIGLVFVLKRFDIELCADVRADFDTEGGVGALACFGLSWVRVSISGRDRNVIAIRYLHAIAVSLALTLGTLRLRPILNPLPVKLLVEARRGEDCRGILTQRFHLHFDRWLHKYSDTSGY